jgi:hypothetical protein
MAELPLQALHPAIVTLMIVPQEVQQPVQSEDAPFGLDGMPRFARLAARNSTCDSDFAEGTVAGEAQHIGRLVDVPEAAVQRPNLAIADEGDAERAARASRGDATQPRRETGGGQAAPARVTYQDAQRCLRS